MNAKDSRSRTQRKVNLADHYGKKWIRNYSPNRGVYLKLKEEVSSIHSGEEFLVIFLISISGDHGDERWLQNTNS